MLSKIFVNLFLIVLLALVQISFINSLPKVASSLNLILIILIFLLILTNFKLALIWAVSLGYLLDLFSFYPFGIYLVSLSLTIVIAHFLLTNFFTNRSLYSFLALVAIATINYEIFINSITYLINLTSSNTSSYQIINFNYHFWQIKCWELGSNLLITIFLFYLISFIGKSLRPVFLAKQTK